MTPDSYQGKLKMTIKTVEWDNVKMSLCHEDTWGSGSIALLDGDE
jgi:hypothetical protein